MYAREIDGSLGLITQRRIPVVVQSQELSRHAERTSKVVARWPMRRTPRQFMERHGGGARFAALDDMAKSAAMARLANWASAMFGSLDAASDEDQSFVLQICRFRQEAMS